MGLPEFWEQMCHSPMLMVSTVLTLGVILVNGWTDAPNAIAIMCFDKGHQCSKSYRYGGGV